MLVDVAPEDGRPENDVEVLTRASLARGKSLSPGIQWPTYFWRDLVDGSPPRRRQKGGALHVTYHGTEEGRDVRVSYSTIVRVDPGDDQDSPFDDTIFIDDRLHVQRRALHELIDREREFSDRLAARMRSRLAQNLVRQRVVANRLKAAWAVTAAVWFIRLQARAGFAFVNGLRTFLRALVDVPDTIVTRATSARLHLSTRAGRRTLKRGLMDPAGLSADEKGVVLLLVGAGVVGSIIVFNSLFALFLAQWATHYSQVAKDFTASLLSVLALPLPQEPMLINSTLKAGPVLAFVGLFAGKVLGSWILYIVGDSLYDTLNQKTEGKPRMKRAVTWVNENANKRGLGLLTAINGIPLMPDVLVYAFAVSGMRFRTFMGGIALGTTLKFVAIITAVMLLGPEEVSEFLAHPIRSIRGEA